MLAIAEARAKGLELVARPLKTKVTLPSIALSFVIVIRTVTIHNHTVYFISSAFNFNSETTSNSIFMF